jgi:hypothetical protein
VLLLLALNIRSKDTDNPLTHCSKGNRTGLKINLILFRIVLLVRTLLSANLCTPILETHCIMSVNIIILFSILATTFRNIFADDNKVGFVISFGLIRIQ